MPATTAKAKTWRSFQFLDGAVKAGVVALLEKKPFGADVEYKVDGAHVLTNAPLRDFGFAIKRELNTALPDAVVLDGDPRGAAGVQVNADQPVETADAAAADAAKAEAQATKEREAAERKAERERVAAEKKTAREKAAAEKAEAKAKEKAAREEAKAKAKAERAANSPKSKAALRAEAGTAEAIVAERHGRMFHTTVEIKCGKCDATKEVHIRSWAGIGYTYCNNCHAKLPYVGSAGSGLTEKERFARRVRLAVDKLEGLSAINGLLDDATTEMIKLAVASIAVRATEMFGADWNSAEAREADAADQTDDTPAAPEDVPV